MYIGQKLTFYFLSLILHARTSSLKSYFFLDTAASVLGSHIPINFKSESCTWKKEYYVPDFFLMVEVAFMLRPFVLKNLNLKNSHEMLK